MDSTKKAGRPRSTMPVAVPVSISLYPHEVRALDEAGDRLGLRRSEAARLAISLLHEQATERQEVTMT